MTNFTASGHQLVTRQRNGKDGRSVSKVDVVYQRSTSATSVPTTWVTTAPKLPKGYYLWSATKVTYKEADGKTTTEVIGAQCIASADNLKTTVEGTHKRLHAPPHPTTAPAHGRKETQAVCRQRTGTTRGRKLKSFGRTVPSPTPHQSASRVTKEIRAKTERMARMVQTATV